METTHFSPNNQEPASSATKSASPRISKATLAGSTSRVPDNLSPKKDSESLLQVQELYLNSKSESTRQLDEEDKEASRMIAKENGREKLKRHREEVAGDVRIPEKWSQESLLKDWMDYSSFDKLLAPKGLQSAREALIAEGRRGSSQRLRIGSRCYY
ncbi:protein BIC1-like [Mercurialis annua]|uniref:protein BIC1-like n=1 Tax=Mercurialis annua TaxID=3986 RepID=UPI00215EDC69|nr:protein BIC1-like [Mercurialis annua]